ncbi:MAG: DUF3276 family protein [Bacteroidota bacterium]
MQKTNELHSESIRLGKRTYFFDLKQAPDRRPYLLITQSEKNAMDQFSRQRILLNSREMVAFGSAFFSCLIQFQNRHHQQLSLPLPEDADPEQRANLPSTSWSREEDLALEIYLGEELGMKELSAFFQRKESAIRARIKQLGLTHKAAS